MPHATAVSTPSVEALWKALDDWRDRSTRKAWDSLMAQKTVFEDNLSTNPSPALQPTIFRGSKHLMAELVYAEMEGKTKFAKELEHEHLTSNLLGQWIDKNSTLTGASKTVAFHLAHLYATQFDVTKDSAQNYLVASRSELLRQINVSQITLVRANHALADSGEWEVIPGVGTQPSRYRPLFLDGDRDGDLP